MVQIEKYGHGGDLQTAELAFGKQEWLDFSANINPLGPPETVVATLHQELGRMIHYPDPGHRRFRHALAQKLGVPEEWLLIGNGAAECMALALQHLAVKKVGVLYPCFSEYTELSGKYGAEVSGIYGTAPSYKPKREEVEALIRSSELVFIGTPNNPTGIIYSREELLAFAQTAQESGTWLVVDEAFLDFAEPHRQFTLLPELARFSRVLLIRSMTKMYAIPGLRLGYTIAHADVIEGMRKKQITWSVNQLALIAGEACLAEDEYVACTRELIKRERQHMQQFISDRLGWDVTAGEANFLLIRLPQGMSAEWMQEKLGRRGILIRSCSMYPGLDPEHIRVAVRTRAENDRLLMAFADVMEQEERSS
ncbi:threonine-phosphate decarboxylase CobD [Brevibacillus fluminis]|uniref:threonine-phosphate decarboxylase CobD n=1 Tax=Brevibacillus fluminis TaxID=511487 RepID=UPI003F8A6853